MALILKSNMGVYLQSEGQAESFEIQADSGGYLLLVVSDGKGGSVPVKMSQELTAAFVGLLTNANMIRLRAPTNKV
jgi:hypothetical protein